MAGRVLRRIVSTAAAAVMPAAVIAGPASAQYADVQVVQLAAGYGHTCGVGSDSRTFCWGRGAEGQLGNDRTTYRSAPVAVTAPAGVSFTQLTAGQSYTCGVGSDTRTYCWGSNDSGQLGDGGTANRSVPAAVDTPAGVGLTQLTSGDRHTCGLGSDSRTYCWGLGTDGQLGDGGTANRSAPVAVSTPAGVRLTQLDARNSHTCGMGSDSTVYCWGYNGNGQLGDGSFTNRSTPVPVNTPPGVSFTQFAVGGYHTCGLGSDTKAYCWGLGETGQAGNGGTANRSSMAAVTTPSGVSFTQLTAGSNHTCALGSDTRIYCWGYNRYGQVGDGSATDRLIPVPVDTPPGVSLTRLAHGWHHTCGLGSDTRTYCWGLNETSQLGDGGTTDRSTPMAVSPFPSPTGLQPPSGVTAMAGDQQMTVYWTAPSDLGDGTLTGYTATTSPGGQSCTTTATMCTITGLTNGTSYTVAVVAGTTTGPSAASNPSAPQTPAPPPVGPQSPTGVTVTDGQQITVSWTAPSDLGDGTLTGYTATTWPGGQSCTTTATTCTIGGLTNGAAYRITVTAATTSGTSTIVNHYAGPPSRI
ncbi:fibronectin type III domain-containing protein [Actinoplanes sp. NPDC023801]|uniref:RCC1 domain-containing protein n=1 Tax=Actinoplanes sp. NPDC023801 TaxID=3154595 RepID=UPI0033FCCDD5